MELLKIPFDLFPNPILLYCNMYLYEQDLGNTH